MSLKWFLILFGLIVLIAGAPLLVSLGAGVVASHYGCTLNEGGVYPCVIHGHDYGHRLNLLFMLGWFGMLTLPYGIVALCILVAAAAVVWIVRLARRR
jgi:hypothetical protein